MDFSTNNIFVRFGFISWQEVKSSAPPRDVSNALSTFSGEEEEEEGKTRMSDADE